MLVILLAAALSGGLVSAAVELLKWLLSRRQTTAATALTEAQTDLVDVQAKQALSDLVDDLTARLTLLRNQLDEANDKARVHIPWDEHVAMRLAIYEPVPSRPPL